MSLENVEKKDLVALAAELNEKRAAKIATSKSKQEIAEAIMAATENGTNAKKLNKPARATLKILAEIMGVGQEAAPNEASAPEAEKTDEAPTADAPKDGAEQAADAGQADTPEEADGEGADDAPAPENGPDTAEAAPAADEGGMPPEDWSDMDLTSREAKNIAAKDMNVIMGLMPGIDISIEDDAAFNTAFNLAAEQADPKDNFSEFTWAVFAANKVGPERAAGRPVRVADAAKMKKAASGDKPKREGVKRQGPSAKKGPGVIASVKAFVDEHYAKKQAFTIAQVHDYMKSLIPDHPHPESMLTTIRILIPGKLTKEKGYKFQKDGENFIVMAIPAK